jgi:hypothetical protein
MVARCSTDAATVFDDLRQAVRNIAFHSDPTLGEIKIGGALNPARKASRPVPGHHHSCEIGNPLSTSVGTCVPTIAIKNCGLRVVTLLLQL